MIVDVHAHLGYDVVFDENSSEEDLLYWGNLCGVNVAIVQPFISRPYLEDTMAYHDRVHQLCRAYPGRFFGMASINPHFREADFNHEAVRCVKELKFVGLKMTPIAHAVNPSSADGHHVFEVAKNLKVPLMIHTGSGMPFADPSRLLNLPGEFPEVPIILAHAGSDLLFSQALYLAQHYDNVYLEPSWLSILSLKTAIQKVGASKIMFSSDHAANIPVELAKYKTLLGDSADFEQAIWKTANDVFSLNLK